MDPTRKVDILCMTNELFLNERGFSGTHCVSALFIRRRNWWMINRQHEKLEDGDSVLASDGIEHIDRSAFASNTSIPVLYDGKKLYFFIQLGIIHN